MELNEKHKNTKEKQRNSMKNKGRSKKIDSNLKNPEEHQGIQTFHPNTKPDIQTRDSKPRNPSIGIQVFEFLPNRPNPGLQSVLAPPHQVLFRS